MLSASEELDLVRAAQGGDRTAEAALLKAFEPLGRGIARRRARDDWALEQDLRQEARIGTLRAIRRHNADRSRLSTTARLWATQEVAPVARKAIYCVSVPGQARSRDVEAFDAFARAYQVVKPLDVVESYSDDIEDTQSADGAPLCRRRRGHPSTQDASPEDLTIRAEAGSVVRRLIAASHLTSSEHRLIRDWLRNDGDKEGARMTLHVIAKLRAGAAMAGIVREDAPC